MSSRCRQSKARLHLMTMLLKLSDQISECLQYAVDARERADAHTSGGLNWRSFSPGSAQAFTLAAFLVVIASLIALGNWANH